MKMSLEWHENCLGNVRRSLDRLKDVMEQAEADYAVAQHNYLLYRAQVEEARARGLDGFDRDRLLKKRSKK